MKQIGNVTADTEFTFEYGIRINDQRDEEVSVMENTHKEQTVSMETDNMDKKQEGTNTFHNNLNLISNSFSTC